MIINVEEHPEIKRALELIPGSQYLILISSPDKNPEEILISAKHFGDMLHQRNINGVVVVIDDKTTLKIFDMTKEG